VKVFDAGLAAAVERLIALTVEREIMPRFGRLAASDLVQKKTGGLVTTVDRRAEDLLSEELVKLLPGSTVIGEEAVAEDPSLLLRLRQSAPAWIIDPIDGTENFAAGSPRFSVVVALAVDGEVTASWIIAPLLGVAGVAMAGGGAFINGTPARVAKASDQLRHLDVSTSQPRWWSPAQRRMINSLSRAGVALCFFDAVGLEYLELAGGRRRAAVFTWEQPWDHAAGILLHAEAGGVSLTASGGSFRVTGDNSLPVVVAGSAATAAAIQRALNPDNAQV
jgi:fructose-1,6-bisphosphatase/inositol monophosphatase family enzyme